MESRRAEWDYDRVWKKDVHISVHAAEEAATSSTRFLKCGKA